MTFFFTCWDRESLKDIINFSSTAASDDYDANDNDNDMDIDGIISDDNHTIQVDEDAPLVISQPPQTTTILQPKPKLHYMNNIKIFLTNIVILDHIACSVGAGIGKYYVY